LNPPVSAAPAQGLTADQVKVLIDEALAAREKKQQQKDQEPEWYAVGSKLNMTASWKHGVWFETPNKDFTFHVGGTVQYDLALYTADDAVEFGPGGTGPFNDGANLRRGRLRAEGSMWEVMDYLFELEFFNGVVASNQVGSSGVFNPTVFNTPGPTDAWISFKNLPILGHVRIGSMKEPFSLEHLNSYRFLEFMERSYLFDAFQSTAFNNGFTPGIMAHNTMFDDRGTWWLGFFKNDSTLFGFNAGDGEYAVTGRLTALPVYECDGLYLWHVGVAGSHRDPVAGVVQERVRDQVRNAPFPLLPLLANTGNVVGSSQELLNLETAAVLGPVTVEAEYTASYLHDASTAATGPVGTFFTQGAYVSVLCFLTGEHRPYDRQAAAFGRVIPNEPFFWVPGQNRWIFGKGAWEVGARYAWVDLSNRGINGGVVQSLTLGVNWYLNPNMKIQWNYDLAHRSATGTPSDGTIQAFGMRMQVDF
jgi:phosphate-selective porin OprO/OprP